MDIVVPKRYCSAFFHLGYTLRSVIPWPYNCKCGALYYCVMVVIQQYYIQTKVCLYVIKYIYYISVEVYTALNEYPN